MGDTGEGNPEQFQIGAAVAAKCAASGCDFVQLLGDNIYPSGPTSTTDGQWQDKFELPYAAIPGPIFAVLGNHDYGGDGAGFEFDKGQISVDYTAVSAKWKMPATFYHHAVQHTEFFALDTNMQMYGQDAQQRSSVLSWLNSSTAKWKIAIGHHAYLSNGPHGNAGEYEGLPFVPVISGTGVKSFMEDIVCGRADVYISARDHNLQWLQPTCNGTELLVSGAGSKLTELVARNPVHFEALTIGFVYVVIQDSTLTAEFIDRNGTVLFTRSITKTIGGGGDDDDPTCPGDPACPAQPLDFVFLVDTTADMASSINNLKSALVSFTTALSLRPNTAVGLAEFRDFPTAPFGSFVGLVRDQPYQLVTPLTSLTTNLAAVTAGINALQSPGNAGDILESGHEALYQLATGAGTVEGAASVPPSDIGFRAGSKRFVIVITNADFHSPGDYPFPTYGATEAVQALNVIDATVVGMAVDDDDNPFNSSASRGVLEHYAVHTGAVVPPSAFNETTMCKTGLNGTQVAVPSDGLCRLVFDVARNGSGFSTAIIGALLLVP
jgi:hypothetical protein